MQGTETSVLEFMEIREEYFTLGVSGIQVCKLSSKALPKSENYQGINIWQSEQKERDRKAEYLVSNSQNTVPLTLDLFWADAGGGSF